MLKEAPAGLVLQTLGLVMVAVKAHLKQRYIVGKSKGF